MTRSPELLNNRALPKCNIGLKVQLDLVDFIRRIASYIAMKLLVQFRKECGSRFRLIMRKRPARACVYSSTYSTFFVSFCIRDVAAIRFWLIWDWRCHSAQLRKIPRLKGECVCPRPGSVSALVDAVS